MALWQALALYAQEAAVKPPLNRSVSGSVREKTTGRPLANYNVSTYLNAKWQNNTIMMTAATKDVVSKTDASGHYRLADLPPGTYRIEARPAQGFFTGTVSKTIQLAETDVEKLDFSVDVPGVVTGRVKDDNGEPMPGMTVLAVSKEYYLGAVGYYLKSAASTNDRGEYRMERLEAGHPYLLLAERRKQKLSPRSDAPLNPAQRRPVPMRTWYPNSTDKQGAAVITLRPGEERTGIDIAMKKAPSFCAEGVIAGATGPVAASFTIEPLRPSSGPSAGGGMFMAAPGGVTGTDGKFRICDLYPGSYRLTAEVNAVTQNQPPVAYTVRAFDIGDRDLSGMQLAIGSGVDLAGEIALDGPPPQEPISAKLSFALVPLLRTNFIGMNNGGRYDIPSTFSLKGAFIDDYGVRAMVNYPGLYVKDVTYGGRSILYAPARLGSVPAESGFRVIVGQDGGTATMRITNKDGNPVPDMHVVLMPADVNSEAELQARYVSTMADQSRIYTSATLAPGRYYAAATAAAFDATEESIRALWQMKLKFTEFTIPPGGKVEVKLQPLY